MSGFDWKATVRAVAPAIGTVLGGPLGGMATNALLTVFGLGPDASDEQIASAVQGATPDQLLALKKADNDFKVQMKSLDIDLEKIAAGDRDSSRHMQIETKDWTPRIIAVTTFLGFFAVLGWIATGKMPIGMAGSESFTMLLGSLGTILTQVVSYYFGSSAGSSSKDATIKAAISK